MITTEGRQQSPWGQGSLLEQLPGGQHEGRDEKIAPKVQCGVALSVADLLRLFKCVVCCV